MFAQSVLVKGVVRAPDGNLISNVEIAPDVITDANGYYEFTVESEYLIAPEKVDVNLDCFSESDSEAFSENVLFNGPLNLYDLIVMDLNNSNSASTFDLVILNQAVTVGVITDQFRWLFITEESYSNNPNPTDASLIETIYLVNDFSEQEIIIDWVAFLKGNVDGNYDCQPVSIAADILKNDVSLYPNPVSTNLSIDIPNNTDATISVFNLLGQQVSEYKATTTLSKLDFSKLNKGIYMVEIRIGDAHKTFKVLKE